MNTEKLIRQLFVGKVAEIIGMEKTLELLKEATDAIEGAANTKPSHEFTRRINLYLDELPKSPPTTVYFLMGNSCGKDAYLKQIFSSRKFIEDLLNRDTRLRKEGELWVSKNDSYYFRIEEKKVLNDCLPPLYKDDEMLFLTHYFF